MDGVVTWEDLIKVVLFILGVGVLFYLLLAVSHLVGILKNINKMLEKNRESITSTLGNYRPLRRMLQRLVIL